MNNLPNPPALTPSALVRVVYDDTLVDARTGQPVECVISYEDDAGEHVLVLTFGSAPLHPGSAVVLAAQLRAHAGAPDAHAGSSGCTECAESRCDDCARPAGSRLAADDVEHPVCCCGRRFRDE